MTLEDRIVRLERQNRWMKCAAVVLVGLFVTLGQSKPADTIRANTVEAQEFRLVDERGELRSGWITKGGTTGLAARGETVRFFG